MGDQYSVYKELDAILKENIWLGSYEIIEVKGNDFTVYFENDEDARKFERVMDSYGATTTSHSCH